jgi:transposase
MFDKNSYFHPMGRKKRYIKLTAEQKAALEVEYKTGHSHDYRSRCHCILLSSAGWSMDKLMDFFQVTRVTLTQWFDRYETEGLEGLKIRPGRGRKRKLDIDNADHVKQVKSSLKKENRNLKQLRQDLESKYDTTIGDTTLRRFLKDLVTDTDVSDTA